MALLIAGDTVRVPELRHEVPLGISDPFLFVEVEESRRVVITALELDRVRALGLEAHPFEEFGYDDLIAAKLDIGAIRSEIFARACRELGVGAATVPAGFPLGYAEALREAGIELRVDQQLFDLRRRVKNAAELAGIRRAQRAAEAGMAAALDLLRSAAQHDGGLRVNGQPLTVELVKERIEAAFSRHGATAEEFIVAPGAQAAVGHEAGSGAIAPGEAVVIDLWPRDRDSTCFADMTRTFVVGSASEEIREYHRLTKEALDLALALVRPGVHGRDVYDAVCGHFEAHGYPTGRSKESGAVLQDGFFHGLGHGVGLEVHEHPGLSRYGDELVAGDVITIEPGLYRKGFGGVRLEDLVLVTEDGAENLTAFPYDLEITA
jgi:Xaa-Pro aminopeptidase